MANETLNKLCKWRTILAGAIWGTSFINAPGTRGKRDLMDKQLIYRVELTALAALLIKKKVFTAAEFAKQVDIEAELYERVMQREYPGFRAVDAGIQIFDVQMAQQTMKDHGFPE